MADLTLTPTVYLAAVVEALGAVSGVASARSYGLLEDDAEGPLVLVDLAEVESLDDVDPALWHARLRVELIILAATSTRGSKGTPSTQATRWRTRCAGRASASLYCPPRSRSWCATR